MVASTLKKRTDKIQAEWDIQMEKEEQERKKLEEEEALIRQETNIADDEDEDFEIDEPEKE